MGMGRIEYFGHFFKWQTRGRQDGQFEALVTVNACVKVIGLFPYQKAAWKAAKAEADRQIDIYRKIVILQAGMKRKEKAFRAMARGKFVAPPPASKHSTAKTNETLRRVVVGMC